MNEITLGEYLRKIRNKKQLTTRELGENIGFSYSYIASVEKGRRKPSKDFLEKYIYAVSKNNEELTEVKSVISSITDGELYKDFEKKKIIDDDSMIAAFTNDNDVNTMYVTEDGFITDKTYNFPINDIFYHLTDKYNSKYFKGIKLSDNDRSYINDLIKIHMLEKYKNELSILNNQLADMKNSIRDLAKINHEHIFDEKISELNNKEHELKKIIMELEKTNHFL
ncbi:helix-turn-helix domain-containing protein [Mammaliicoccus lentus]|uniref:helix-turn-helix domain-containing protein n=1 Tax=Mammaliicoccus lentus TaxID=42858 RepID=UPI002DBF7AF5|nr:helix-turn-helix transcriptional regulator [Mammaliicoccus lentus]MEB5686668.1 helix-turn-helix domain-containing protein [Mammaliicoccus lentus]